jgi:hypothetical protein
VLRAQQASGAPFEQSVPVEQPNRGGVAFYDTPLRGRLGLLVGFVLVGTPTWVAMETLLNDKGISDSLLDGVAWSFVTGLLLSIVFPWLYSWWRKRSGS